MSSMRLRTAALLVILAAARVASAQAIPADASAPHRQSRDPLDSKYELVIDLRIELPVTIAAAGILLAAVLTQDRYGPETCRWCDTRSSLNALDSAGLRTFPNADHHAAVIASDVLVNGVAPVFALGLGLASSLDATRGRSAKYRARRFGIDVLLMAESTATALSFMQLAKFTVERRRPGYIDEPLDQPRTVNGNLSFFSGHSTQAFVLATSAGTIASLHHERLAPLVWVLGLTAATTTAMLRVAANEHFVTDVLTGAVVGSAIGAIVPVLHRYRSPVRLGGTASATFGMLTLSGNL